MQQSTGVASAGHGRIAFRDAAVTRPRNAGLVTPEQFETSDSPTPDECRSTRPKYISTLFDNVLLRWQPWDEPNGVTDSHRLDEQRAGVGRKGAPRSGAEVSPGYRKVSPGKYLRGARLHPTRPADAIAICLELRALPRPTHLRYWAARLGR